MALLRFNIQKFRLVFLPAAMKRPRFLPDNFVLAIIGMVVLATFLPAHGSAVPVLGWMTNIAVALLFFLHGARLSRDAVVAGILHWRLHLVIFLATFALFPILGLLLKPIFEPVLGSTLYMGMLFICALPSTVQSSIAFTSVARGNIPAAICAASFSNLIGIVLTPLLVGLLFTVQSSGEHPFSLDAIYKIVLLLLVPFVAGQIARRWIGNWVIKNKSWLKYVDQSSILLVVYGAFSEAVMEGIWHQVSFQTLIWLLVVCSILLALIMLILTFGSRKLGFNKEDEIAIVFCGSKKSLATGVPIAQILFVGQPMGLLILPIMLFHQIQLMVCAMLANRYAKRPETAPEQHD